MVMPLMLCLPEVLSILGKLSENFEFHGHVNEGPFKPASLLNVVDNGIYYDTHGKYSVESFNHSIVFLDTARPSGNNLLIVTANPQLAYYKFLEFAFKPKPQIGIHPTAIVDSNAKIHPSAYVGPFCVVEDAVIGANAKLHSSVTIMKHCSVGEGSEIEANTVVGATGVVWCWDAVNNRRVYPPQLGGVKIGSNCFIGSNISIVRGSINEMTLIDDGVVMAHGTKIGHGSQIGKECHLANNVTIGGNVEIGARSFLGSGCILRPGAKLGNKTTVGCGTVVLEDFLDAGLTLVGVPARILQSNSKVRMTGVPDIRSM